jgi:hypothetical protein
LSLTALPLESPTLEERAVLRTVLYASLFEAPLALDRLHRHLQDVPLSPDALKGVLLGPFLRQRLEVQDGHVFPRGRAAWLRAAAYHRERTRGLLRSHRRVLGAVASFPWVRLAALSGACAHDNARDSDVDVFLVVRRGRAWTVCLALMLVSKLLGRRRTLCLNYIVDDEALELPERDLFTASELVAIRPLAGPEAYVGFLQANRWAAARYPNFFAGGPLAPEGLPAAGGPRWRERLLDLCGAGLAERAARAVLSGYLRLRWRGRDLRGVVLGPHRIKLHTLDHGPRLRTAFEGKLRFEVGDGLD